MPSDREMLYEMYGAYRVQCGFLRRLKEIHEEWSESEKTHEDTTELLDKVHEACQQWYQSRKNREKE